jgi:hypothetical protein
MIGRLKLSPHVHSGKRLHHHHTSYPILGLLLLLCGLVLGGTTMEALASPGPQAGSISLTGSKAGPPPAQPPVITSPRSGQHFGQTPIGVAGTCPADTLVELFKNDVCAGSGQCGSDKTFNFQIDLLYGQNSLVARAYDALNQASPDSNTVIVFYDAAPPQSSPLDFANLLGNQLLLRTSPVLRGTFPGVDFYLPVEIIGGRGPYGLSIDWGDGKKDLLPRGSNGAFDITHQYGRPGTYVVMLRASDADAQQAFLQVLVIVNGQGAGSAASTGSNASSNGSLTLKLVVIWPFYLLAIMLVIGFWLGEKRERLKLEKQGLVQAT